MKLKTREEMWQKVIDVREPDLRIHSLFDIFFERYKKSKGITFTEEMLVIILTSPTHQEDLRKLQENKKQSQ